MADKADVNRSIEGLLERAIEVLGDEKSARNWLHTPKRALGGEIPLEMSFSEEDVKSVYELLGRIEHGVYS